MKRNSCLLCTEARKLTVHNSTKETRERYTQDLNALNALLAERLNQRVAVDYELAQILNRPPVPYTSGGRVAVTGTSNMNMPIPQMTPRPVDNLQLGQQTSRSTEQISSQSRRVQESQQFQSPRTPRDPVIDCVCLSLLMFFSIFSSMNVIGI